MRLDAFIGPGHVSTVIGCRPYEWIAQNERKPIVVSGFEPLDMLQSIVMLLHQLKAGEAKVENQYKRVVPWEGNRAALRAMAEVFQLRPYFEWRGLGFISQSALRVNDKYAEWDAEQRFEVPGIRVTDPKAAQCGEVLKGVLKPHQCKLFGRECTPEHPIGALMVSSEGSCAAYHNYEHRKAAMVSLSLDRLSLDESSASDRRACRIRCPYGSAIRRSRWRTEPEAKPAASSSKGSLLLCFSAPRPDPWAMRRTVDINGTTSCHHHRQLCGQAPEFSRRLHRRTCGERHRERSRGFGSEERKPWSSRYVLEAGLPTPVLEAEVRAMAKAAREAGVRIAAGDTKVVEHGKADQMYITTTGIGRLLPGVTIDPRSVRVGDKILLSGPIGDHGITILLARGELDFEADLRSDTRSVLPLVEALIRAAGPGIRWMRDPTRGGAATSLNELARDCGLGMVLFEDQIPVRDTVRGACELLGLDPLHIANEGQFLAVVSPEYADAAINALSLAPGGSEARMIGEVREQPAGTVLVTTLYGGSRIVDMLVGDPLPRIC